jgi:UDP-N-acetylmuramoyl-tripeptide--D-alanyl-D-alanine ligase
MRMEVDQWNGVGIINDAYNANSPQCARRCKRLRKLPCRGRRIAVLEDMFELGKHSAKEHRAGR